MSPTIHQMLRRGRRVLATLLAAGMTLAAAGFVLAGLAGFQRYVIVGGSMTGTYDLGSVVFDRPVPVRELRVGDVITYLPPPDAGVPHLVTHRIAQIRSVDGHTVFRTKGDANPAADPWRFQLDAPTQARVQLSVPYVGFVSYALAQRWVRILLIGVPAGLIALCSLADFARKLRRPDPVPTPTTAR